MLENIGEYKKYKYYLVFNGGKELTFETDTDIRTVEREKVNGAVFVNIENKYTINISQLKSLKVRVKR